MRGLQVKVLSDPGQLCRVGSRPVCVRSSCANPCKADHGEINRQIKKQSKVIKVLVNFFFFSPQHVERLAGVERRRLGQLPAIKEGIALVSV